MVFWNRIVYLTMERGFRLTYVHTYYRYYLVATSNFVLLNKKDTSFSFYIPQWPIPYFVVKLKQLNMF